ncbi:MAG: gluconate 2-dehydrogenase subunit 3 family protein [Burkholderiales bacterium]|nr:gluconate 2-dehydrogenase subunit 3 family protein [Burkholderiales bacterium]
MNLSAHIPVSPPAFNAAERAALDVLMDSLIPASPDRRMPAARSLALYDNVATMRATDRRLLGEGLAELDRRAAEAHGAPFALLDAAKAQAIVDAVRKEGLAFVQTFVAQTVGRYVSHPAVMPLLGLEARPLWPTGNVVTEGDWTLLDSVRQRKKIYRRV